MIQIRNRASRRPGRAMRAMALAVGLCALSAGACGTSAVGSVGAVLGRNPDTGALYLRQVAEGQAADQAGLLAGDRIKMIDGVLVDDLGPEQIQARLRGEVGSPVTLTIIRGEQVLDVELTRTALHEPEDPPGAEQRIEP